jgi:pimeloyl-ACP methyl ester carboxylesterase
MRHLPLRAAVLRRVHRDHFKDRPIESWRYYLEGNGEVPIRASAHQARLIHGLDLRPLLAEIRQPILLVAGSEDDVVPCVNQEALLAELPNARLAKLSHCGHIPHHTHPERLAELITLFLTPPPNR